MGKLGQAEATFDYDAECDWYLLSTCNYRCDYCFLPSEALGAKLEVFATPREWSAAFDATGKRWLIHITGGEPTVHPDFAAICEALTGRHLISINSNLSRPSVRMLAGRVDPMRVSFINAGLHPAERARRAGFEAFLGNARLLQDAGFRVYVTAVVTPDVATVLPELASACASRGLQLAPKVLRGVYGGKTYPRDYAPAEKERLREAIASARERYDAMYGAWPRPSIDVLSDDELLDGRPLFRGRPCSAGFRFVRVSPNGDVHRCNSGLPGMGNLLRRTLRLGDGPAPCNTAYCVYFCKKYTAHALEHIAAQRRPAVPVAS